MLGLNHRAVNGSWTISAQQRCDDLRASRSEGQGLRLAREELRGGLARTPVLRTEPQLDPFRGDPRFEDLVRRVGIATNPRTLPPTVIAVRLSAA